MHGILRAAVCIVLAVLTSGVRAQQAKSIQGVELHERDALNAGTVTVITAPIGGPMSIMGSDMAAVLDAGDKLRVLPDDGKGSAPQPICTTRLSMIDWLDST